MLHCDAPTRGKGVTRIEFVQAVIYFSSQYSTKRGISQHYSKPWLDERNSTYSRCK
jgi:hypothetical protein